MKPRYISIAIVLLLVNYLIFATLFSFLLNYRTSTLNQQATAQRERLPTFTPAPAQPVIILPTATPTVVLPTPTNTRVVSAEAIAPTATPTPKTTASLQATGNINIRKGPGVNYDIITQLKPQETMPVIGRNEDSSWWQIRLSDGGTGWVANNVVKVSQGDNVPISTP